MKKTIKCGIVAAVAVAAGFAAYQSYGSYGVQESSLLMQNVEALAQNNHPEPGGKDGGEPNGDKGKTPSKTHWVETDKKKEAPNGTGKQIPMNKCEASTTDNDYCTIGSWQYDYSRYKG